MKISDIPDGAQLITDSQDVRAILVELGTPVDEEYGGLFVTDEGKVYGFSGIVPYLDKIVNYLGEI
jgi:repressor of nif and glnA expression